MRIFFGIALGVVLAVDGSPFLGHLAGGQPQPETEEVRRDRVQFQSTVRLVAMQEDRHAGNGDVGQDQRHANRCPGTEAGHAIADEIENCA